jgi:parallel beta-helix repeat protein
MKSLLSAFFVTIIFDGLILASGMSFGTAQASTNVAGIIYSDTTWTKANSPYNLTGIVTVNEGVTLKIEAGATINLNSYNIQVNGTLVARGTSTTPIQINKEIYGLMSPFDTVGITFNPSSTDWNSQTATGCIIQNAIGTRWIISIDINIDVNGGSPVISGNKPYGIDVEGGSPTISNNTMEGYLGTGVFGGNNYGVFLGGSNNAIVSDNTFIGLFYPGAIIASSGAPVIERNLIKGSHSSNPSSVPSIGITVYSASPLIENNTITENDIGLNIYYDSLSNPPSTPPLPTIIYNNIQNNSEYSIYLGDLTAVYGLIAPDVNASYNWWGTTNISSINQTIYDHKNNFNVGTVTFTPILTSPNPEALPNSTAEIPEFPTWIILPIFMIATLLIAVVYFRKRKHLPRTVHFRFLNNLNPASISNVHQVFSCANYTKK